MGRSSTFTQDTANAICERLAIGTPLAEICRDEGMPAVRTVYDWRDANPIFAASIARARDEGFDAIAADSLAIVDTTPERTNTDHGDKVDAGHVAWLKNRAEQRLKLLAKWDPKRYGERQVVDIGNADGKPFATTDGEVATKLAAIIAAGLARKANDSSDLV